MKTSKRKTLTISVLALCAAGMSLFLFSGCGKDVSEDTGKSTTASTPKAERPRMAKAARTSQMQNRKKGKLKFDMNDDEYAGLTKEMRTIVEELQTAIDDDDDKSISHVCAKILKIMQERGERAVPSIVREDAVEALGHSLPGSLPELMRFMADGNADVREAVNDQLDGVLSDSTIGDRNLSPIMTTLAKIITDEDLIDSMVTSLESNLRNSIKIETYKQMLKTATDEVKRKVRESIDELLDVDEDEVKLTDAQREKGLDKYLAENPDEEDDDDLFGGSADNDSDDN